MSRVALHLFLFCWWLFWTGTQLAHCQPNTVRLNGLITPEAAIDAMSRLERGDVLQVNSPGGQSRAAMVLARFLRQNDITLLIDGACLSGCAAMLFLAAPSVVLTPRAVVGAFKTGTGYSYILQDQLPARERAMYATLLAEERRFFAEIGVPLRFFEEAATLMKPFCIRDSAGGEFEIGYIRFGVIQSPERLRKWQIRVPEGMVATGVDLDKRLAMNKVIEKAQFTFVGVEEGVASRDFGRLPDCDTKLEK